jgi:hypothetical protein
MSEEERDKGSLTKKNEAGNAFGENRTVVVYTQACVAQDGRTLAHRHTCLWRLGLETSKVNQRREPLVMPADT